VPSQVGTNSLISILVAIGLLFTLLKTPSIMMQFAFYSSGNGVVRKVGSQIVNAFSADKNTSGSEPAPDGTQAKAPRKVVHA